VRDGEIVAVHSTTKCNSSILTAHTLYSIGPRFESRFFRPISSFRFLEAFFTPVLITLPARDYTRSRVCVCVCVDGMTVSLWRRNKGQRTAVGSRGCELLHFVVIHN
jgi:hypothetical protein